MVSPRFSLIARNIATTAVRRHGGGVPGENLPFDTKHRYKFTIYLTLFISSALAVPFVNIRHQMLKD